MTRSTSCFLFRMALAVFLLAAVPPGARAQASATGNVAGRVSDEGTQLALAGARVQVVDTALETYTDRAGNFFLSNVPAGAHALVISYVGYDALRRAVQVVPGQTARVEATFGQAVELERFVIEGSVVGTARALNQQRASSTLTSIVAADEIGRFPDQNAAESLQRLAGVSLYRDQGEGRFVDLRGLNYIYTAVTLNGAKVASPEIGGRFIALDVVPADSLSVLEVIKVPTPDMDGEGLGGVVNIKTKSPFDFDGQAAQASAQTIYSGLTEQFGSKFNALYSTLTSDQKLGFLVSATWQERRFGSHNYEIDDGWTRENPDDEDEELPYYFLQDIAFRDYEITRERWGASAAVEYRPDSETLIGVKATYNRFVDSENRHVSYIPFFRGGEPTALDANSATIDGVGRTRRDLRNREKDQELFALSVDAEKRVGAWTFDGRFATSRGHEEKPSEIVARFRHNAPNSTYRYVFDGPYSIQVTKIDGPGDTSDAAFYDRLDRVSEQSEEGTEREHNLALNARLDFDGNHPGFVKVGGLARWKEKESDIDYWEYDAGPLTFAQLASEQGDYPYFRAPRINAVAFREAFTGNRSAFDGGVVAEDSFLEDFVTDENIFAAYGMGGMTFGKLRVTTGVRYERTEFDTAGNEVTDGGDPLRVTASRSYDHWLPGVQLRYDVTPRLVVRASYSTSLMRPEFSESSLFRGINTDDEEVTQGNPDLEALESRNWDASVEYYLPSLGVVSAAVFHKDVKNFSYEHEVDGGYAPFPDYELTTFANGSDATVDGVELAYSQQLRMLPAPFDRFGVMANVTFVDSEAAYPTRPDEDIPLIGQSDVTGNLALTYEKAGFFARLALNWRSEHLREDEALGGDATEDFWIDRHHQLDLSLAYRMNRNWEIFAEATNLTNEPFRVYQKGGGEPVKRLVQFEEYDVTLNFGVRWSL